MKESMAKMLLKDIELLTAAHSRLLSAKKRIQDQYPSEHEQIRHSLEFASWIYFKGYDTDDKAFEFVKKAWDNFKGDKSQLWTSYAPDHYDSMPEADRLLNRIDIAMGLISQQTHTKAPIESIRDYKKDEECRLKKVLAFAQAANDLE